MRASGRLVDDHLGGVAQVTAFGHGQPLTVGARATRQGGLAELGHHGPVPGVLQVGTEVVDEAANHLPGWSAPRVGLADQLSGQPAAGGAPHGRAVERSRRSGQWHPCCIALGFSLDRSTEQARYEERIIDERTGVTDTELNGGVVMTRTDVPVAHLGVGDHSCGDECVQQTVVVLSGLDRAEITGRRPPLPDHCPHAGVAGVFASPERRRCRQSEQHRGDRAQALRQPNGEVPVRHSNVDLHPANEVLFDKDLVVVLHP